LGIGKYPGFLRALTAPPWCLTASTSRGASSQGLINEINVNNGSIMQQYTVGGNIAGLAFAVSCAKGELLVSTDARASDKNHILDSLSKAASEMRNKLGESLPSVRTNDTPLRQATTPSLEALKEYNLGVQSIERRNDPEDAVPFLQRAVQLEPQVRGGLLHAWRRISRYRRRDLATEKRTTLLIALNLVGRYLFLNRFEDAVRRLTTPKRGVWILMS
jgi:hypothetical protein